MQIGRFGRINRFLLRRSEQDVLEMALLQNAGQFVMMEKVDHRVLKAEEDQWVSSIGIVFCKFVQLHVCKVSHMSVGLQLQVAALLSSHFSGFTCHVDNKL